MELKKITQDELDDILYLHERWVKGYCGGIQVNLSNTNLSGLDLSNKYLGHIDLSNSNLTNASLIKCDLFCADLSNTNLTEANLSDCYFHDANLTNVKGLPSQEEILDKFFEKTKNGYVVYKVFGLYHNPPSRWRIEENSIIEEDVDMSRKDRCSYGINVATINWIKNDEVYDDQPIWKCLIKFEDLDKVCVPYGVNGNVRCGKLKLLEII